MIDEIEILKILQDSPSVELLRLKQREIILEFFIRVFKTDKGSLSYESLLLSLSDFLEYKKVDADEDSEINIFDTYEEKAKKYIKKWTNKGFLTNYRNENGDVIYELSSHTNKTIDWLSSLKKREFVGTESKFKMLFNQLKEIVEYSNEDVQKRIEILKQKELEIKHQIERLEMGEDVKVFEEFEITPRFNQLLQMAKELLSDFKEVEDNFKNITKEIYQKHSNLEIAKSEILSFTFDALDELKESQQGKSFYSFWHFLMSEKQNLWNDLVSELYKILREKNIPINDDFLLRMTKYLYISGQKVTKANDKMAEKLSRIIRESAVSKREIASKLINEIKSNLIEISKTKNIPNISLNIDTDISLNIPFDRRLTYEQKEEIIYEDKPLISESNILESEHLQKIFSKKNIDEKMIINRINKTLNKKNQATLLDIINENGGINEGLAEVFTYIRVLNKFTHNFNTERFQEIIFNKKDNKLIRIPEIIILK